MGQITYTQVGDYLLPDLKIGNEFGITFGKYGMLRKPYLRTQKPGLYSRLLLSGNLIGHLANVDALARTYVEEYMLAYLKVHPAPDKATRQMEWVGYMNGLKQSAEEVVMEKFVYL